ncbi:biopolymer transporter ExbD [Flavobacterium cheongpyeongense]|uniref:Biopolymer transporter ExbD n=1 Tax=Flavobacterium cheongpyeongense TaxID=2212651 RepID=A0A2V4BZK2_9FLAO|nr:biopolymer transporter ExbD [Flavobacterium cheongpyeongense]PXY39424.1 biopolymer transporter ExbD [Flavobacterium cheongpyeongense]
MENLPEKTKSQKRTIRIILIIIVSISLLFVLFFMAVIKLTTPKVMTINLPETSKKLNNEPLDKTNTESITILLGENNKIIYYVGALGSPIISPKKTNYGENGIRKELILQNKSILENSSKNPKSKKLIAIIKPSSKSTYKNLVDILDEMAIANIDTYAIVNDTPEETKLLAAN